MDKRKNLVFRYFDMIFSGYKKQGRRPVYMKPPHVLLEYKNEDDRVAFNYDTEADIINFQITDFRTAMSMFGVFENDMYDICREYIADKFNKPSAINAVIYARTISEKFD